MSLSKRCLVLSLLIGLGAVACEVDAPTKVGDPCGDAENKLSYIVINDGTSGRCSIDSCEDCSEDGEALCNQYRSDGLFSMSYCPDKGYECTKDSDKPVCAPVCTGGTELCGTKCVDKASDKNNCGVCDKKCGPEEYCNQGKCEDQIVIPSCQRDQKRCICEKNEQAGVVSCKDSEASTVSLADNEFCLDPVLDKYCGITKCEDYTGVEVCGIGLNCRSKKAEGTSTVDEYYCACPEGTIKFEDKCTNRNDPATCGIDETLQFTKCAVDETGKVKDGVVCNGSACICASNYYNCNDSVDGSGCKNLTSDHDNCGACGNVCQSNTVCKNGSCVCEEGLLLCDGTCIDPLTDADHCGAAGTCTDDYNEVGDNSNFKGNKCMAPYSSGCYEGTCGCTGNFITLNGNCINPSNDDNYCGATSEENPGQNCTLVPNAQCKSKQCVCQNGFYEVYNDHGTLLKCVDVTSNNEYCGKGTGPGEYMNCLQMCDGSNVDSCNDVLNSDNINLPWSCIPTEVNNIVIGQCKQRCPGNTLTCLNKDQRLVCVDETQVKYTDETSHICACIKCDNDDDPTNGCSAYSVGESLDHCTACNVPCATPYNACNKNELGGQVSYSCGCKTGEQVIKFDGVSYCLNPADVHLEQKDSGNWDCSGLWVDKNGEGADGCEFDSSSDPENCGTELNNCYTEHVAKATCENGICIIGLCTIEDNANYDDCNKSTGDGCESNLSSDVNNCGVCNRKCDIKGDDYDGANNKCESENCCITGEANKNYGEKDITCCAGTRKYKYSYQWSFNFWESCWNSSHYGCFQDNPDSKCWTLVE